MDTDFTPDPVLIEVEAFLLASQMTATSFGQRALNDPTLVHELRRGRECKIATRRRIRNFIRDFASEVAAASEGRSVPSEQREAV